MKKIKLFGLGLLLSIALLSCSNGGESDTDSTSLILPKKISIIEGSDLYDTYFTYDGNKIVSEIRDTQYKTVYTYTGNLITKYEQFNYEELIYTENITYNNGKLTSRSINQHDGYPIELINYVHNIDGTVSYSSNNDNNGMLTFLNGNLMEDATVNNGTDTYEYDTKNNPFKNVLGISALLFSEKFSLAIGSASKNNYTKLTNNYEGYPPYIKNSTITYNSSGYPIEDVNNYNESIKYYYE